MVTSNVCPQTETSPGPSRVSQKQLEGKDNRDLGRAQDDPGDLDFTPDSSAHLLVNLGKVQLLLASVPLLSCLFYADNISSYFCLPSRYLSCNRNG